jgi:hypothetical protein
MTGGRVAVRRGPWLYGLLFVAWLTGSALAASSGDPQASLNGPDPFPLLKEDRLGELRLGLTEKEVKARIPGKLKKGKEEYWAATGDFVQKWKYSDCGVTLDMSSEAKGGQKTVSAILVRRPSLLKTKRGIGIGSLEQEVVAAYGECQDKEMSESGRSFVAGSIYGGLIFFFENGRVTRIFLGAGAE